VSEAYSTQSKKIWWKKKNYSWWRIGEKEQVSKNAGQIWL